MKHKAYKTLIKLNKLADKDGQMCIVRTLSGFCFLMTGEIPVFHSPDLDTLNSLMENLLERWTK